VKVRLRAIWVLLVATFLSWAAPLVGLAMAGRPVEKFLHFPPRTGFVAHAPFNWGAFAVMSIPALCALALFLAAARRARCEPAARPARSRFPWWGWVGFALIATGWTLAWTDGVVSPEWRRHCFTPLWIGYVLVMNGLARRRTGHALLTHRTRWFLALFPVSAAFWWLFEHLNQFAGNWHYSGIEANGDWDYFLQASLPFSTVLPAVASTWAWLKTFPRFDGLALPALQGTVGLAWLALLAGTIAMCGIGLWPEHLYFMLWLAPLLVLLALEQLVLGETLLAPIAQGDWRPLLQPALAGLICGLFWELWNYGSTAKWHYSIPYVQRFHLFEMPLLGYAGYLPFGVECAVVMDLVAKSVSDFVPAHSSRKTSRRQDRA
jgi:hypothetical protein